MLDLRILPPKYAPQTAPVGVCYFGSRVDWAGTAAGLSGPRSNFYLFRAAYPSDIVPRVGDEVYVLPAESAANRARDRQSICGLPERGLS